MTRAQTAVAYEVQFYEGGKWHTDAAYENRLEAESKAEMLLDSSKQPPAVRVVQEKFDPDTNLFSSNTVFRKSRVDDHNDEVRRIRVREATIQQTAREARRQTAGAPQIKPVPKPLHWGWYVVLFAAIVSVGGGLIYAAHSLIATS